MSTQHFDLEEAYLLSANFDAEDACLRFGNHIIHLTSEQPTIVELNVVGPAFTLDDVAPLHEADVFSISVFENNAIIETEHGAAVVLRGQAIRGVLTPPNNRELRRYAQILYDDVDRLQKTANDLAARNRETERMLLKQIESLSRIIEARMEPSEARGQEIKHLLPILRKLRGE